MEIRHIYRKAGFNDTPEFAAVRKMLDDVLVPMRMFIALELLDDIKAFKLTEILPTDEVELVEWLNSWGEFHGIRVVDVRNTTELWDVPDEKWKVRFVRLPKCEGMEGEDDDYCFCPDGPDDIPPPPMP
jgi:hypothetical protein